MTKYASPLDFSTSSGFPLYLVRCAGYALLTVTIAIYSIGAVAGMVGTPAATLRTWEERYGVVHPVRSAGGQRLYSREDVERLRFIADQVREGMSPGDAHRLLVDSLHGGVVLTSPDPDARVLVLLAERDQYSAEFAEYFLKTEGFEVVLALDVSDADRAVADQRPLIAIVDLLLSGGAGLRFTRRLADAGVAVLAISTLSTRDEALEAGAAAFLQKPLEPLHLVSAVKDLVGRSAYLRRSAPVR